LLTGPLFVRGKFDGLAANFFDQRRAVHLTFIAYGLNFRHRELLLNFRVRASFGPRRRVTYAFPSACETGPRLRFATAEIPKNSESDDEPCLRLPTPLQNAAEPITLRAATNLRACHLVRFPFAASMKIMRFDTNYFLVATRRLYLVDSSASHS